MKTEFLSVFLRDVINGVSQGNHWGVLCLKLLINNFCMLILGKNNVQAFKSVFGNDFLKNVINGIRITTCMSVRLKIVLFLVK